MKVFISWSGKRSKVVAQALHDWLPNIIQSIHPWVSAEDIGAGARWGINIANELSKTQFGIICVTQENQKAPWILFEAGALAKTLENTYVCPYLIDLTPSQIDGGPLTQFQTKQANKQETWELICTVNKAAENGRLSEARLQKSFERWWPDLDKSLQEIPELDTRQEKQRSVSEMMEEVLYVTRDIARVQSNHYMLNFKEYMIGHNFIRGIFETLSPKEERIFRLRLGLGEEKPSTLKEIAAIYGESTTTISKIEHDAIRKFFKFFENLAQPQML